MDQATLEGAHNRPFDGDVYIENGSSLASSSVLKSIAGLTEVTETSSVLSASTTQRMETMKAEIKATSNMDGKITPRGEVSAKQTDSSEDEEPYKDKSDQVNMSLDVNSLSDHGGSSNGPEYKRHRSIIRHDIPNPGDPIDDIWTMQERIEKAPKQLSQMMQYTRLMEERMQLLEQQVRELKGLKETENVQKVDLKEGSEVSEDSEKSKDSEESEDLEVLPTLIPEVRRVQWSEFCLPRPTHSIDVLYGDPEDGIVRHLNPGHVAPLSKSAVTRSSVKVGKNFDTSSTQGVTGISTNEVKDDIFTRDPIPKPAVSSVRYKGERPSRIRIVSKALREVLNEITGYSIEYNTREVLAPFKPLILFEEKIRDYEKVLEENLQQLLAEEAERIRNQASTTMIPSSERVIEVNKDKTLEAGNDSKTSTNETELEPKDLGNPLGNTTSKPSISGLLTPTNPPVYTKDVGPEPLSEVGCSPQDISQVMLRWSLSRANAVAKLRKYGGHIANSNSNDLDDFNYMSDEKKETGRFRSKVFRAYVILTEWKGLLSLFDNDLEPILKTRSAIKDGTLQDVHFDDLCYLFLPGQMVMATGENRQVLQVFSATGGRRLLVKDEEAGFVQPGTRYTTFCVDCYHYDFDGVSLGVVQRTFEIKRYTGLEKLKSLPLYPGKFRPGESQSGKELMERGKKFVSLCSLRKGVAQCIHRKYSGLSFDDPPEDVDGHVVIDADMAFRVLPEDQPRGTEWVPKLGLHGPTPAQDEEVREALIIEECDTEDCDVCTTNRDTSFSPLLNDLKEDEIRSNDFLKQNPLLTEQSIKVKSLKDDDYTLMPCRVFGFVLRSRKWARLDVDNIHDIAHETNNFDKLVLPKGHKEIVQALVETHFKKTIKDDKIDKEHNFDLVQGKGKGLIILLHGAPGVGKTSTAECVAAHTEKPLFSITCGDIGDSAKDVEKNLDRCFQMAHKWGCILLLDEADVFLAKRGKTDLKRNALVSVFLRVLEYYAGILFLTTNRVGTLDEAFKSRIHMSLGYPQLTLESTKEIWQMNINRTKEAYEKKLKMNEKELMRFAKSHFTEMKAQRTGPWNGRQIRNAFQTAIALAQWEAKIKSKKRPVLDVEHFEKVTEASSDFDKYLKETYGGANDSAQALNQNERADSYYNPSLDDDQYHTPIRPKLQQTLQSSGKERRSGRSVRTVSKEKEEFRVVSSDSDSDTHSSLKNEDSQVEESINE